MNKAAWWTVTGLLATSVLILAFAVGYVVRGGDSSASSADAPAAESVDFDTLNEIVNVLEDRYIDPDLIDRDTLYQAAISGLLGTLSDTGTYYVDPETVQRRTGLDGTFEGIGATVSQQNGEIVIVAPIKDTPADRAGLETGDVIVEVNGESTAGWTTERAVFAIRGPRGSTVTIKIRHTDGTEEVLEIERDEILVASVTTQPPGGVLENGAGERIDDIAYIYIRQFNEPTIDEVRDALREAVQSGKRGIILDVRNNPGGLLLTTKDVADEFLDGGKTILTERKRDGSEDKFSSTDGGEATAIPIVVIQNRFSASGAEVLAAALHDNGRATIVGEKSFGKGTVNISNDLDDGGKLYVSIAKWVTPDGIVIDGVGVRPDVEISLTDEDIDLGRDMQLYKAIDVLLGTNTTPAQAAEAPAVTPEATPSAAGG